MYGGCSHLSQSGIVRNTDDLFGPTYNVANVSEGSKDYKYGITAGGAAKFYDPDGKEISMKEFKKAVGADFDKFKDAINAECRYRRLKDAI